MNLYDTCCESAFIQNTTVSSFLSTDISECRFLSRIEGNISRVEGDKELKKLISYLIINDQQQKYTLIAESLRRKRAAIWNSQPDDSKNIDCFNRLKKA